MEVLFVGGVHGVGKTHACISATKLLECEYYTASQLIKEERSEAIAEGGKQVKDVNGNQDLLIKSFLRRKHQSSSPLILLDGHFVLRDSFGKIQRINSDLFEILEVTRFACFYDDPKEISLRIKKRDCISEPEFLIKELQDAEIENAKEIARKLKIDIEVLLPSEQERWLHIVRNAHVGGS